MMTSLAERFHDVVLTEPLAPGIVAHRCRMVAWEKPARQGGEDTVTSFAPWPACQEAPDPDAGEPVHVAWHSAGWAAAHGAIACKRCWS